MMNKITELLCVTEEEICKVRSAYNKTEKEIEKDVDLLLEWLDKQPQLPKPHDRTLLEHFLLRNKFRIEQTKIKLDNYYAFKVLYPELYVNFDPESNAIQTIRKCCIAALMPRLSPNLDRILYLVFLENQEEHYTLQHIMTFILMFLEFQMYHDYSLGETYVCDLKYLSFKYVMKIDVNILQKALSVLQQGFSGRFFQIHFVNISPAVDILMNILKRILTMKILGKMKLHKNFETLYEFVPKDYLPKDAGGNLESVKDMADKWMEEMILQKEFLKESINRKSNENLRIGKLAHDELFGMDGTFRKINLD